MRFILNRFFKNIPFLHKYFEEILFYFDKKHYDKNCLKYKIIPLGSYCLPRIITTINRLKPPKKYGEKTCVFDLAFFRDIECNAELIKNHFDDFFDYLEYFEPYDCLRDKERNILFVHDKGLSLEELKEKYIPRINNFYDYVNDKTKHIYFLMAVFEVIKKEQIEKLLEALNIFRKPEEYDIIIINQSEEKLIADFKNVHIIDLTKDTNFKKFNINGNWAVELKKQKLQPAKEFYKRITKELKDIIK